MECTIVRSHNFKKKPNGDVELNTTEYVGILEIRGIKIKNNNNTVFPINH